MTGFTTSARRIACTTRPGSEPMYVRRCPRISASSRTPPSDMRTNLRPSARAIERPSEVLPTPGGPDEAEDRPFQLADEREHRDVVEDPLLHVLEAVVVLVEHGARARDVHDVVAALVPRAARSSQSR